MNRMNRRQVLQLIGLGAVGATVPVDAFAGPLPEPEPVILIPPAVVSPANVPIAVIDGYPVLLVEPVRMSGVAEHDSRSLLASPDFPRAFHGAPAFRYYQVTMRGSAIDRSGKTLFYLNQALRVGPRQISFIAVPHTAVHGRAQLVEWTLSENYLELEWRLFDVAFQPASEFWRTQGDEYLKQLAVAVKA